MEKVLVISTHWVHQMGLEPARAGCRPPPHFSFHSIAGCYLPNCVCKYLKSVFKVDGAQKPGEIWSPPVPGAPLSLLPFYS